MKNLLALKEEALEKLPNRETNKIPNKNRRRMDYYGRKYPYNKVHRFLQSNVGQPWDEVYSKYHKLEWIPKDMKNLEYIRWSVVIDTFLKDGNVWYIESGGAERPIIQHYRDETFFVHPTTKVLCCIQRWVNGRLLKDIAPADGVKYKIYNRKLYLPTKAPVRNNLGPKDRIIDNIYEDVWRLRRNIDPCSFKITLYRQLNSKDLKKYGLRNDIIIQGKRCKKCGGVIGKDCLYHICNSCGKYYEDCKCNK